MRGLYSFTGVLWVVMAASVCPGSLSAQSNQPDPSNPTNQTALATREYQSGYRFFQNTAPEFLQVEILDVVTDAAQGRRAGSGMRVRASARVLDVIRSDSGVTQGSTLTIDYLHSARAGSAAETPPLLQKGKTYPAFLEKKGALFTPAARHLSFSQPSGIQMKVYEEARTRSREKALAESSIQNNPKVRPRPQPQSQPGSDPVVVTSRPLAEPLGKADSSAKMRSSNEPVVILSKPLVETSPDDQPLPSASGLASNETAVQTRPAQTPQSSPQIQADAQESKPVVVPLNPSPRPVVSPDPVPAPAPAAQPVPAVVKTPPSKPAPVTATPQPAKTEISGEPLPTVAAEAAPAKVEALPPPPIPQKQSQTADTALRQSYADIYGLIKEADTLQVSGETAKARENYQIAKDKLLKLKADQPDFQPFIVAYRLKDLDKKLAALQAP